jgi:phosphomannomutase
VKEMFDEYGPHYAKRIDIPISRKISKAEVKDAVEFFGLHYFADFAPKRVYSFDGTKVNFSPKGFILFRPSGTEPVLRIYAETDTPERTAELLNLGRVLLSEKTDLLRSPDN